MNRQALHEMARTSPSHSADALRLARTPMSHERILSLKDTYELQQVGLRILSILVFIASWVLAGMVFSSESKTTPDSYLVWTICAIGAGLLVVNFFMLVGVAYLRRRLREKCQLLRPASVGERDEIASYLKTKYPEVRAWRDYARAEHGTLFVFDILMIRAIYSYVLGQHRKQVTAAALSHLPPLSRNAYELSKLD